VHPFKTFSNAALDPALKRIVCWTVLGLAALLGGCATNTMTGRMQASLVSEASVSSQSMSQYSAMVGEYGKKQKILTSGPLKERVDTITNRLITQAVLYRPESAAWDWQINVIDEPKTVNAFAMPGGLMGFYSGLAEQLGATDDEIAQVMGHEIGHALAGHGAEKQSVRMIGELSAILVAGVTASSGRDFQAKHQTLSLGALAFIAMPNSRTAETESDRIGIELAARAGYRPEAAVSLWTKMAAKSSGARGSFLATHPSPDNRIRYLSELQQPMLRLYNLSFEAAPKQASTFDWLRGPKSQRPKPDPTKAIALYSPQWFAFESGITELKGSNVPVFLIKQGSLKELHANQRWRDLAVSVMDIDHQFDLAYFYLSEAASGLGFVEASKVYASKALETGKDDSRSCAKHMVLNCGAFEPAKVAMN
jgi:Zn-dependent protease with chaperone function